MHSIKARKYLERANKCVSGGRYGLALGHFLIIAKLDPEYNANILTSVLLCLEKSSKELEASGRHQELLKIYESVLEVFPHCGVALNSLGEYLLRHGHVLQSAGYLQRAVLAHGTLVAARDNLDRANAALVDRWHLMMLNDRRRNEAYDRAVADAVKKIGPGDVVLDVGAGTGLLSMMAVRAGADTVVACESSQVMSQLCAAVLADNNMLQRVTLVNKSSLALVVGEDVPKRVSLLVTETFDAGLLGEHILTTLDHAWRHLLLPGGRVLPSGAAVRACAVSSAHLRATHTARHRRGGLLRREPREDDPYDTERVGSVPGGYAMLTEPVQVYQVDFNDPADISAGLEGRVTDHVVKCTAPGRVDALVTWFELDLGDGNMLPTAPGADTCWEQAVYPVYDDVAVYPGDSVTIQVTCRGHLSLAISTKTTVPSCSESRNVSENGVDNSDQGVVHATSDRTFEFATNEPLMDWLKQQYDTWEEAKHSRDASHHPLRVLDLCPLPVATSADGAAARRSPSRDELLERSAACTEWDAVVCCPVLASGRLDPTVIEIVQSVRVSPGGLLAPRVLHICAVAVCSQLVRQMTSLNPANTARLDCSAINMFSVSHLQSFPYAYGTYSTDLSETKRIGQLDIAAGTVEPSAFSIPLTSSGRMDGLVFWFQPEDGSTRMLGAHYRQLVAVCQRPRPLQKGYLVNGTLHRTTDGVFVQLEE